MPSPRAELQLVNGRDPREWVIASRASESGLARMRRLLQTVWLRHDPDVRLRCLPLAEELFGVVVGHGAGDDHVLALLPVDRRGDLVARRQLQRVDHAQHLVEVAPGRHRVDEDQLDLLVRADHEHVADGLVVGRRPSRRVARGLGGEHPVELGDREVGVGDERVVGRGALGLLDGPAPRLVVARRVDGEADDLDVLAVELGLDLRHVAELGRADGREVLRVREQNRPGVTDPVVKRDRALRRLRLKVRCGVSDLQAHMYPSFGCGHQGAALGPRTVWHKAVYVRLSWVDLERRALASRWQSISLEPMAETFTSGSWTVKPGEETEFVEEWKQYVGWAAELPGAGAFRLVQVSGLTSTRASASGRAAKPRRLGHGTRSSASGSAASAPIARTSSRQCSSSSRRSPEQPARGLHQPEVGGTLEEVASRRRRNEHRAPATSAIPPNPPTSGTRTRSGLRQL